MLPQNNARSRTATEDPPASRRWPALSASLVITGLVLAVSACGSDKPSTAANDTASLVGSSWVLSSAVISGKETKASGTPVLAFDPDGKTLNGTTGCNSFSGTYTENGSKLTIALGPTTLAACTDPGATAQEAAILAGLPKVASFTSGSDLVLKDSSGATLLTYGKGLSSVAGTSWKATGINNGKGAVSSTNLTDAVDATFDTNGGISGSGGCNSYNGQYAVSGSNSMKITNVAATKKICPDDVMAIETEYLAALANVATYELSGHTLTLRDSSGATQVTYALKS